ncbi:MAG: pyridoxamine 5'-phosphate oxidase family protein [Sulfurimonas sp.]|uniref:pyridoxamine 5'-phosphate oxidase family protein n=1 Tax=Sulfurimonas sp. TaxID=2022749 RepID=UPI00261E8AAB|nr:pyridoxamine 5'-phosphate oxidase family protein [Sulfurimonas sp.]MDD5399781.1 pyridoxamine 5'-phosphate oxidase family protein [Sulfurimonas sp.]
MSSDLQKVNSFLQKHHVLTLATTDGGELSACNLFYVFDNQKIAFVVASGDDTMHIKNITKNPKVAGTVVLETKTVGKIEGIQFRGDFLPLEDDELKKQYFKNFPYALAMNPKLWQIKINYFKLTDNTLGFGKKIIWQEIS